MGSDMIKAIASKGSSLNIKNRPTERLNHLWRFIIILLLFIFFTALIISRLVQLHITETDFLRAQGNARTLRIVDIPSYRGMITDRRGTPLAISTPVHAVWINPQHFDPDKTALQALATLLSTSPEDLLIKISHHAHRSFVYLKRGLPPDIAEKIQALNLSGLGLKREFRRYYPSGQQSAQLVGFTDIDDHGQSGLELTFEESLRPIIGKKRVLEDRTGRWVQDIDHLQTPHSGQDVHLSIDLRIQGFAYRELEQALEKFGGKSATLVMLDIRTGEVLAMVSAPSYNPNNRQECHGSNTRNRAVTDLIEPGSTMKTFSIVSALLSRQFTPETLIDTYPGYYSVNGHTVKDLHPNGILSVKEVLSKSSNVGISKITLALPPEQLIDTFRKLGLGEGVNTNFPGERQGLLPPPPKNPFVQATLSFGYGLSVTPLQIVQAYATLAANGVKHPVSLLKIKDPSQVPGEQILPPDIASATLNMLTAVLTSTGTGHRADISGYKTAGKTGTTRIVGPQGYDPNRHIGLFVGITPVENPRLATLVMIEEPNENKNQYFGGFVAAPVYKNVVSKALHILNIPPDNA